MNKIIKTQYYSFRIRTLPKGCQLCVQGKKTVLFITGLCARHCDYCPISEQKKNKDVVYANEWPTKKIKDLFTEIELCGHNGSLMMVDATEYWVGVRHCWANVTK